MVSLLEIVSQAKKLKPTATVVRGRNGRVKVERQDLLSPSELEAKIAASMEAGKKREQSKQENKDYSISRNEQICARTSTSDKKYTTIQGEMYEFYPEEKNVNSGDDDDKWKKGKWMVADNTALCGDSRMLFHNCSLESIKVTTFNVWFDTHEWKRRTEALLDLLVRVELMDVICLQEVTPRCLCMLLEKEELRKAYRVTDKGPNYQTLGSYGVVMLVRRTLPVPNISWLCLPTRMGRSALVASFETATSKNHAVKNGKKDDKMTLAIATVHLESLAFRNTRAKQLRRICAALQQHSTAILVGDYNISATGPYGSVSEHQNLQKILEGYDDLWIEEHGTDGDEKASPRFLQSITFNSTSNLMLLSSQKRLHQAPDHARLDRVFVRSSNREHSHRIYAHGIRIIGDQPIGPDGIFISDHFGLAFAVS